MESHIRIYIIFLCINMALMLGGFSVSSEADIMHAEYGVSGSSDSSAISGFTSMIKSIINFFFGGGIAGMLISAGMPWEIQIIVGTPFFVLGVVALAPLVTAGANVVRSLLIR